MAKKDAARPSDRPALNASAVITARTPAPELAAFINKVVGTAWPLEKTGTKNAEIIRADFSDNRYNNSLETLEKKLCDLFRSSDLGLTEEAMRRLAQNTVRAVTEERARAASPTIPSASAALNDAAAQLPEKPLREFRPRKDDIIDYIRAPDGFGPWLDVGVLTRPMIRQFSKKAYGALYDYLKKQPLPDDIVLPTRTQLTNGSLQAAGLDPADTEAARRLRALAQATLRRATPVNS